MNCSTYFPQIVQCFSHVTIQTDTLFCTLSGTHGLTHIYAGTTALKTWQSSAGRNTGGAGFTAVRQTHAASHARYSSNISYITYACKQARPPKRQPCLQVILIGFYCRRSNRIAICVRTSRSDFARQTDRRWFPLHPSARRSFRFPHATDRSSWWAHRHRCLH